MSYILVVDDEKDIRDLIGQILLDEGHIVKPAHNSTSAMDYINNEEPSLIILDIWPVSYTHLTLPTKRIV